MNGKKAAFTTLGCKVNLYDTEAMMELFQRKGYEIVDFEDFADVYIINTCTVTNFGDKKSRQAVRRAKRQNANAIIAAVGCYAQVAPDEVEKIDGVNIVIGTKDRSKIVDIIENYNDSKKVLNTVSDIMSERTFEKLSVSRLKGRTRAYLKIQEGCNRFCSYCIIPFARGPVRSRHPAEIIEEVKRLALNGFKEIVFTGIHVASYGADLDSVKLIDIIEEVNRIDGIERIRFSSLEPNVVNKEFMDVLKSMSKVCDHFHLSLQSGCDKILKRMNRRYTAAEYETAVLMLRSIYPDAAITTDIIVGFPGETDDDFMESMEFARKVGLAKIHVFPYSQKKGTKAAEFDGQIDSNIKNDRSGRMISLSNELNKKFLTGFLGRKKEVLFERCLYDDVYEGHTTNYITVHVKSDRNIINEILNVEITEILKEETVFGILSEKYM